MLTAFKTVALGGVLATLPFAANTASAESVYCDRGKLASGETAVLDAQARFYAAIDWAAQNRTLALLVAATEQLRLARVLCDVLEAREDKPKVSPFEPDTDPFAPVANLPTESLEVAPDMAAWLLVCGTARPRNAPGWRGPLRPKTVPSSGSARAW